MKTRCRFRRLKLAFRHRPSVLAFWRRLARAAVRRTSAPCYVFAAAPVERAFRELSTLRCGLPVRHWLSCKTQPLDSLLRWWERQRRDIEVVSEWEFLAAQRAGFSAERILINGPAKHEWLPTQARRGLQVNFDSLREMRALLPLARRWDWRVGVRCLTAAEFDPETPERPTPFGLTPSEAVSALRELQRLRTRVEMVHFHLRTNVASPLAYERAIREVAGICRAAHFAPRYLDCGGGLPPPHTLDRRGVRFAAGFDLAALGAMYRRTLREFPSLEELWLENGRRLLAGSGILVIRVLDLKYRRGIRQVICNGGRTLHALVATWEQHRVLPLKASRGRGIPTAVHGPTCMAFDQLGVPLLPENLQVGDHLLWLEAGAYHLPWETRFSHGLAGVFWHENHRLQLVRAPESFPA